MHTLRVLIIADDPLTRAGLAAVLTEQTDCDVVGQSTADGDLVELVEVYQPEVMLWDLGWDSSHTLDRLMEWQELLPPILTLVRDETAAAQVWTAGARGIVHRETSAKRLAVALYAVMHKFVIIDPLLVNAFTVSPDKTSSELVEDLTPRELEVLQLIAEGLPNKQIAQRLKISDHTVKFHINAILSKLDAQSRTEAVVRATRVGLLTL